MIMAYRLMACSKTHRSCTLHGRIISLKQDASHLHYRVVWPEKSSRTESLGNEPLQDDTEALLKHYFSLKVDLESLYKQWSDADPNFRKRAPQFTGVRILSQDAWETLVSFICSSNNNISRISQMVSISDPLIIVTTDSEAGSQAVCDIRSSHRPHRRCPLS